MSAVLRTLIPEVLLTSDIARAVKRTTATVRRWADAGQLPPCERDDIGHRVWKREAIEQWLAERQTAAGE